MIELVFFYIALYVGAGEYHVVRAGQSFTECQRAAQLTERQVLPFDEETPVTSMCFAMPVKGDDHA